MSKGPRSEGARRGADHIDYIHKKMWVVQAACFSVAVLVFLGTLIAASINMTEGFPCFFAAVVDYGMTNVTLVHTGMTNPRLGGVVPVLFFQTKAVAFLFYSASVVFVCITCYIAVGAIITSKKRVGAAYTGRGAFVLSLMASPSTILLGTVSIWLLQAVVIVLAHKLIVLAAAVYLVHFSTITFFYGYFCGRGVDSKVYAEDIAAAKNVDAGLHRLIGNGRAVMINLVSIVYSMLLIMASLMLGMLLANSFTLKFWHVIVTVLITSSVLTLMYLLVLEFLVARYVHMILGAYIGLLIAYGMLWTTSCDYVNRFYFAMGVGAGNLRTACHSVLAFFTVLIVAGMIVRLIRAGLYHRRRSTRAYAKARQLQRNVKERLRRMSRGRDRPDSRAEDERALTQTQYSETSDDETIYDRVYSGSDSEWDE
ncbi:glycoprotein M [Gallid alphaherpesvirus 3]|uniref:UL10 product homolog n=2 Tax=Gallid alphaherpesvirus 3 TaxID=35250 RepID=Q9YZA5_9ALPH|nr:envelope glycoprotein M [Gallid alphaherpesvirus 3]YP_010795603.1 UL10 protein [Gallid alphaherpesvirus 3]BAA35190.1 UL10 [Marek's disease virus serotype 2 MDV2]AEI00212.1 UL10 protein [Gallid alphaherpesvirus 3]QEY02242.1 UL10 protein [Gallid alphaherpesvirus 3]BAA82904.1 UL10 product homolog [Marek's disease virus serotype 2 MDV2]BAB16518.1 glycoprotein M [Gallid alphaherpesvirus 3]